MIQRSSAHQPVTLVAGYLRHDSTPYRARTLGLVNRVAIVLSSYMPGEVDQHFDVTLYSALIGAVRRALGADRMVLGIAPGPTVGIEREEELLPYALDAGEPISVIAFFRGSSIVAVAVSEPYVRAGGPEPYHDSYTVPVFTEHDTTASLEAAIRDTCLRLGTTVEEVVPGHNSPDRSWLRHVVSLLRRFIGLPPVCSG